MEGDVGLGYEESEIAGRWDKHGTSRAFSLFSRCECLQEGREEDSGGKYDIAFPTRGASGTLRMARIRVGGWREGDVHGGSVLTDVPLVPLMCAVLSSHSARGGRARPE